MINGYIMAKYELNLIGSIKKPVIVLCIQIINKHIGRSEFYSKNIC